MTSRGQLYKSAGLLLAIMASATLFFVFFSEQSWNGFIKIVTAAERRFLLAFLGLHILAAVFRMQRYRLVLSKLGGIALLPSRLSLLLVTFARNAFADFLPLRLGEGIYFFMVNRLGVRLASCTSSFGLCLALDLIVLALMFLVVMVTFSLTNDQEIGMRLSYLNLSWGLLLVILVLCLCYHVDQLARPVLSYLARKLKATSGQNSYFFVTGSRVLGWCLRVVNDLRDIRESQAYWRLFFLTLGLRSCKYLGLYLLVISLISQFGLGPETIPFPYLFLAFVIAEASTSLPISGIMGFGVSQGVWVGVLTSLGVDLPHKLTIALGVHVISQLAAYSLGVISLFVFFILMLQKERLRKPTT